MNKLEQFIETHDLTREKAAVELGVSLKCVYDNLKTLTGSMIKRIEIATEQIKRREMLRHHAEQILELTNDVEND